MLVELPAELVRKLFSRPIAYYRLPIPSDFPLENGSESSTGRDSLPNHGPLLHAAIGLAGEAGEILDTVKKAWAYGQPLDKSNLIEELGDTIFYWLAACLEAGVHPQTVVNQMVAKLSVRYPKGEFNAADAAERKDKK